MNRDTGNICNNREPYKIQYNVSKYNDSL